MVATMAIPTPSGELLATTSTLDERSSCCDIENQYTTSNGYKKIDEDPCCEIDEGVSSTEIERTLAFETTMPSRDVTTFDLPLTWSPLGERTPLLSNSYSSNNSVGDMSSSVFHPVAARLPTYARGFDLESYKNRNLPIYRMHIPNVFTVDEALAHAGFNRSSLALLLATMWMWFNSMILMLNPSTLPLLIQCGLQLTKQQTTLLTAMPYIGLLVGTFIFGSFNDRYGRKRSILMSVLLATVNSSMLAAAPNFEVAIVCEFLSGFLLTGMLLCWSQCVELLPPAWRSLSTFLNIGTFLSAAYYSFVAWLFLESAQNWRWLLLVGEVIPFMLSMPFYYLFVPVSPHYLVTIGKEDKALALLQKMWNKSRKAPLEGSLRHVGEVKVRGSPVEPFRERWMYTTLVMMFLWLVSGLLYFNGMFFVTSLREECRPPPDVTSHLSDATRATVNATARACTSIDAKDLFNLFTTTIGELPAIAICYLLVDRIGRAKTLALCFFCKLLALLPLSFCQVSEYSWISLGVIRAASTGTDSVLNIFVPELYPTYIRNTAVSVVRVPRQFSLVAAPYISDMLIRVDFRMTLIFLASLVLSATICSLMWKVDKRRIALSEDGKTENDGYVNPDRYDRNYWFTNKDIVVRS